VRTVVKEQRKYISSGELFPVVLDLLNEYKQACFIVTGMSMWPFICHGRDKAIVEKCDPDKVKKGDIVLLEAVSGRYLLHRITKVLPDGIQTTGDGNCHRDGVFPRSCIRAKIVKIIRKGKVIDCTSVLWRGIFCLWMRMFPVRRYLLAVLRRIGRLKGQLRKK